MNNYPEKVKEKLNLIIDSVAQNHWLFSNDPGHAFMRQHLGKLSFADTVRLILSMGKGSTSDEIIDFFHMDPDRIPSQSAFIQRRDQISLSAFAYIFNEFTSSFPHATGQFKGCSILAADGCHVVYATNAEILEDFNKPHLADYKGHNHMHLNGLVDVISKVFLDVMIQPGQSPDERSALHSMLDHFSPDDPHRYIITADRGYESYDLIFHCELKKLSYVFRVKAPSAGKCILASFANELPDELDEFDITLKRFFSDKYTKIMKEQPDVYLYMNPNKNVPHFQPLLNKQHLTYLSFRVVKIKTGEASFEYIITNLPHSFDLEDIKVCYHYRWGIETSFRYLKHAAGMLHFHSKKPEFLKQEIYASLIMYNFGIFIVNEAEQTIQRQKKDPENKYRYSIDISTALKTARKYFLRRPKDGPVDLIKLLCRYIHAVKEEFRQFSRPLRGIGAIHFSYR